MSSTNAISTSLVSLADKAKWDGYVAAHPQATAYHKFAWQQAVNHAYKHAIYGVIAKQENTGKIVGVLPCVLIKTPLVGKKLCSLPYCDVGYTLADNDDIALQLQQFLTQQLSITSSKALEIRAVKAAPDDTSQLNHQKVRMLLPLPNTSEALMAGFKSKLRSQIRKAEKNGLTVSLGTEQTLINDFYTVYTKNMRDLGSPVHSKKWFEQIVNAYAESCILSVVYKDNSPIGGGFVIKNTTNASIPWASTLRDYNKLAPNMLLYWSLLAHCADSGIETFDFGRSTYEEGTYKFKKQWGAQPQLLHWQKFDQHGVLIKEQLAATSPGKLRPIAENMWQKLPLTITVAVGSAIRPHISL
jgi:FemAB-related protein (PEP-CTERM system-associated)